MNKSQLERILKQLETKANAIRTVLQMFDKEPSKEKLVSKAIKPHWTQTPEGRALQSKRMKLNWKKGIFPKK